MIVVDSAIWIDHLHTSDLRLGELMADRHAFMHPFVVGEIALGSLRDRATFIEIANQLPQAPLAETTEVLNLITSANLGGSGIGYVDAHLLASTMLIPNGALWTRDKRLHVVAMNLYIAFV